jgi:hypothetical protein
MYSSRELLKQELDQLSDTQIQQLSEFVAFLKFRDHQLREKWQPLVESLEKFSEDFMNTREQLPLEIRETFE